MPRKNSKRLTDPGIEKIGKAPPGKRVERFDAITDGLCLRITERGAKSWAVYYRVAGEGRNRKLTLGTWPAIKVAEARELARAAREQAKAGIDPKVAREAEQARVQTKVVQAERETFRVLAETYIRRECPKLARGREIESVIRRELLPHWHARKATDLKRRDLVALTDQLLDNGMPGAAHKLHETARRIMNWGVRRGDIEFTPFAVMDAPSRKIHRDRVLDDGEIAAVWRVAEAVGYPFGPVVHLLLLTGARRDELAGMTWTEIDLAKHEWTIPAARTKASKPHIVPLSATARTILGGLPRFTGPHVFTTQDGARPISGFSKFKARLDRLSGVTGWRLHDLRRTVRTRLAELGIPEIVAEHILAHGPRDPLARTYNQFAYRQEKAAALEAWGQRLAVIVDPPAPNVVPMRGGAE